MTISHSQPDRAELRRKAALFRQGAKTIYDGQRDRADMWFFELWHFLGDVDAALAPEPSAPCPTPAWGAKKAQPTPPAGMQRDLDMVGEVQDAVTEECARICEKLRRKDYSAENADWTAGTLDCAAAIRALRSSTGIWCPDCSRHVAGPCHHHDCPVGPKQSSTGTREG